MKKETFLILMFCLTSLASIACDNFQTISANSLRSEINSLSFDNYQTTLDLMLAREAGGGDDVGNGGDDIRQKFIKLSYQILNTQSEIATTTQLVNRVKNNLTSSKIVVVDNLKLNGFLTPSAIAQKTIFLDRKTWNTINGLLSDQLDPRLEILRLITSVSGSDFGEEQLLRAYASLPFYESPNTSEKIHATPWCPLKLSNVNIEKTSETFTQTSQADPESLKVSALLTCQHEKNLKECRVVELKQGGFANWINYKVTVQGFRYKTVVLTKQDTIKKRCLELQRCSMLFELAPTGQIPSQGFSSLEEQIASSCY